MVPDKIGMRGMVQELLYTYPQMIFYLMKLGIGTTTNTKVEVMALWVVLSDGSTLNDNSLQATRDAKMVVGLFNNKEMFQVGSLSSQQVRIRLQGAFNNLKVMPISREFNFVANVLSKEALLLEEGLLRVNHKVNGRIIEDSSFYPF